MCLRGGELLDRPPIRREAGVFAPVHGGEQVHLDVKRVVRLLGGIVRLDDLLWPALRACCQNAPLLALRVLDNRERIVMTHDRALQRAGAYSPATREIYYLTAFRSSEKELPFCNLTCDLLSRRSERGRGAPPPRRGVPPVSESQLPAVDQLKGKYTKSEILSLSGQKTAARPTIAIFP